METREEVKKLIEKYERFKHEKRLISLNEAQTRTEFIEPLFAAPDAPAAHQAGRFRLSPSGSRFPGGVSAKRPRKA